MAIIGQRFKNAWSAFLGRASPARSNYMVMGNASRPDRHQVHYGNDRSIIMTVYNQIAVDCAAININHVRLNKNKRYEDTIEDSLNQVLTIDANVDQTGRAFIIDSVISMLDEGCVALVPTVTDKDPNLTESFEVKEVRVGKITEWRPKTIMVEVYNEDTGKKETIEVAKKWTPIVENPFYMTMNIPNSTAQRLMRVQGQLDRANEAFNPGKLDLIVQLPYMVKSEAKRKQAEQRRKDIEEQLTGSAYGIAYTDGTEKVIQLNRSLENNLWTQYKDLTEQLFNQLGLSQAIFDGTADEATTLNYYNRTIEPILSALTEEMERKWLSKTARAQGQAIRFFRDPFKLVPVAQLAEISDKLSRNEIMSSNEIRSVIGLKPDKNPKSDMLINSNLNQSDDQLQAYGLSSGSSEGATDTAEQEVSDTSLQEAPAFTLDERVGAMKI